MRIIRSGSGCATSRRSLSGAERPIIVGGTGLYLTALTEGLAEIPPVPAEVRAEADALPLTALVGGLDAESAARIDLANRARVQRAWEVRRATGQSLAAWQAARNRKRTHVRLEDAAARSIGRSHDGVRRATLGIPHVKA